MAFDDSFPDADESLKRGLEAAVAGDHAAARPRLWRVVAADPLHAFAWRWLAKVAENRGEQEFCLARALALDPGNERLRLTLRRAQRGENGDAKPAPRGRCVFCDLPWAAAPRRCARCRGVQRLVDPAIFFESLDVDGRLVRRAVEGDGETDGPPDAPALRQLALARLNLGELPEAAAALRALADADPRDEAARAALLAVSERLQAIAVESGFETEAVDRPSPEELGLS